ncbi:MAG: glycosyltransferase [Pseudomonadota bacterium]|nr:glycosyltransferase [Pseudomonadota bacterium]
MSKPLHVGYVLKRYPRLSETFIVTEMVELRRLGVRVTIFAQKDAGEGLIHEKTRQLDVPIYYLPRIPKREWSFRYQQDGASMATPFELPDDLMSGRARLDAALLAPLVEQLEIDHLHAHFATWASDVACYTSALTGIPFSFTAHAKDIFHEEVNKQHLAWKMSRAHTVVTVSDFNGRYLNELLASFGKRGQIERLYNGIDLDLFLPQIRNPEPNLIVAVGRLVEKKGFDYLIHACHLLQQRGQPFTCIIVGDGEQRAELEACITEYGMEGDITLVGAMTQADVIALLRRATVFTLPCIVGRDGNRDGLPTVLLEAMALGVPVVSTRVTGIPEIIDDRQTGLLVEERDAEGLAAALAELLQSPALRQQCSSGAQEKVTRQFNAAKNVKQLNACFCASAEGTV